MKRMSAILRSLLYTMLQIIITPPYAIFTLSCFWLPPHQRYQVTYGWTRLMLFLLKTVCGLHYRIIGAEHIPKQPSIVLSKHQSAWETLAFQQIFPHQVWVLKKELLRIPFFGWGLAMTSPIAIDRSSGKKRCSKSSIKEKIGLLNSFGSSFFQKEHAFPRDILANIILAVHGWLPILAHWLYPLHIMLASSGKKLIR